MKNSFRFALLAVASVYASDTSFAQVVKCGSEIAADAYFANRPAARNAYQAHQQDLVANALANAAAEQLLAGKTTASGPIPVIFHVVLTSSQLSAIGGAAGVAARVDSSIVVLNRDYNRRNPDSTRIPAVFKSSYGAANIQFATATIDPNGEKTAGYEIYVASSTSFNVDQDAGAPGSKNSAAGAKYTAAEGGDGLAAWNPEKYLNVWVTNISYSGGGVILGVATPPSLMQYGYPRRETGVVISYGAFGKRSTTGLAGYYISGIDRGRTLTHELGHFFELLHVFGNSSSCPGSGDIDDGIADTPPQDAESSGCPTTPPANTCSSLGKMFVNYMDYSDDACLVMFTNNQSAVMQNQVAPGGGSYSLTQNPQLTASVNDRTSLLERKIITYPNPASAELNIEWPADARAQEISLFGITGNTIKSVTPLSGNNSYQFNVTGLPRGLYTIRANFADGTVIRKIVLQ